MEVITTKHEIRRLVWDARCGGRRVGVVPTMGALHEGHLSLVQASAAACDMTIVTIFVNPSQFGPHEDFAKYPRDLAADVAQLVPHKVDALFAPPLDEIYRPGHSTFVDPPAVAEPLEGAFRPTHFRGVATIVLKLFQLIPADVAFFGQKDYQQSLVIRHMVEQLDLPIAIQVCPTIREPDGLALSSRNVYLNTDERQQALALYRALRKCVEQYRQGCSRVAELQGNMHSELLEAGIAGIDYAVVVDRNSLQPIDSANDDSVALIAARVGKTRLIDNLLFS
jgi:pantoate--beta-alanine ligase